MMFDDVIANMISNRKPYPVVSEIFIKARKLRPEACNFIKKEALAQVFSCEFCEIFKNTFFTEKLRTTTFDFFIMKIPNFNK